MQIGEDNVNPEELESRTFESGVRHGWKQAQSYIRSVLLPAIEQVIDNATPVGPLNKITMCEAIEQAAKERLSGR